MEFLVTYTGHVNKRKAPDDWPSQFHQIATEKVESKKELASRVQDQFNAIIVMRGMFVYRDAVRLPDPTKLNASKIWVPIEMLTHVSFAITAINGESPIIDEDGNITMPDGAKVN